MSRGWDPGCAPALSSWLIAAVEPAVGGDGKTLELVPVELSVLPLAVGISRSPRVLSSPAFESHVRAVKVSAGSLEDARLEPSFHPAEGNAVEVEMSIAGSTHKVRERRNLGFIPESRFTMDVTKVEPPAALLKRISRAKTT